MKGYPAAKLEPADYTPVRAGDTNGEAVRRLVEGYLPMVARQADRGWLSPRLGLTRDDLLSAGAYGLLLAARRYDPGRGVAFPVFARSHIHGALMREINHALHETGADQDHVLAAPDRDIEPDSLPDEPGEDRIDRAEAAELRDLMEYALNLEADRAAG